MITETRLESLNILDIKSVYVGLEELGFKSENGECIQGQDLQEGNVVLFVAGGRGPEFKWRVTRVTQIGVLLDRID